MSWYGSISGIGSGWAHSPNGCALSIERSGAPTAAPFSGFEDGVSAFVLAGGRRTSSYGRIVQASNGAFAALTVIAASIPVGIARLFHRVAAEVPRGPSATISRLVEIPVKGLAFGVLHLARASAGWAGGSLIGKDSFSIA
ncbi:MAG TPA: hypothetical protein PLZ86_09065, partial [bacterium]|nr:hypothetical protein [bacterium]